MLDLSLLSGSHTLKFMNNFDYIRQAGSRNGARAAAEIAFVCSIVFSFRLGWWICS